MLFAPLASVLLAACHAGLPPEPPGADPADPAVGSVPYQVQPNPYETSAFAGEPDHGSMRDGQAGHEHMGHGSNAGGKQAPAPAAPTEPNHSGHGATEKKPPADSETMPPNMHKHPEAPR